MNVKYSLAVVEKVPEKRSIGKEASESTPTYASPQTHPGPAVHQSYYFYLPWKEIHPNLMAYSLSQWCESL